MAAALASQFANSSALTPVPMTPAELEANKSRQHKAEDVIYTLNHAVTCLGVTDTMVGPAIGALSQRWLGKRIDLCGHDDHEHDHGYEGHDHHDHGPKSFWRSLKSWVIGEAVGDLGAVPFTIGVQRLAPSFMHGLRRLMEPAVGGVFHRRAVSSAESWADQHGIARDAEECVARAEKYYNYEMEHLPQMAVWTVASVGINFGTMKLITPEMPVNAFVKGKALGAATTAALVFGARASSPATAHWWDETVGKNIVVPVTKKVGGLFGINAKDVDDFHARHSNDNLPATHVEGEKQRVGSVVTPTQQTVAN